MRIESTWACRIVALLVSIVVLVGAASCGSEAGPATSPLQLPLRVQFNPDGSLVPLPALASPEGVSIRLLGIERHPSEYLFHFNVASHAAVAQRLLTSGADYKFVLIGSKPAGTPADAGVIDLTLPNFSETATHPELPETVGANGAVDGWLRADLSALGYPPAIVDYRYATVHTTKCVRLSDPSTCQPADLYEVLEWDL